MKSRESTTLPISKKWLVDGFCGFTHRMVAKQFHSFAVQRDPAIDRLPPTTPIVVYANHSGWWDPIVAMLLRKKYFPQRILYAPIDAEALKNYRIMAQLGFYGLQLSTVKGASEFLRTTKAILESDNASVWITPEGEFCDVRDHSKPLMPGLAHLASRMPNVCFIPLAIEYTFWNESRPQIFVKLGEPICSDGSQTSKSEWNLQLTSRLRSTQSQLASNVMARDPARFEYLIASRPMRLGWYDYFRSWSAWLQGKSFDPRHAAVPTSSNTSPSPNEPT